MRRRVGECPMLECPMPNGRGATVGGGAIEGNHKGHEDHEVREMSMFSSIPAPSSLRGLCGLRGLRDNPFEAQPTPAGQGGRVRRATLPARVPCFRLRKHVPTACVTGTCFPRAGSMAPKDGGMARGMQAVRAIRRSDKGRCAHAGRGCTGGPESRATVKNEVTMAREPETDGKNAGKSAHIRHTTIGWSRAGMAVRTETVKTRLLARGGGQNGMFSER